MKRQFGTLAMVALIALLPPGGCAHNPNPNTKRSATAKPATAKVPTTKPATTPEQRVSATKEPLSQAAPTKQSGPAPDYRPPPLELQYRFHVIRTKGNGTLSQSTLRHKQKRLIKDMAAFYQAWQLLQDRHVHGPYPKDQLVEAAIRGLLKVTKDKHTRYLSPAQLKRFESADDGEYGGVGILMHWLKKEKRLLVERVLPGTPAAKAGVRAGDEIVTVDGQLVKALGVEKTAAAIRGKVGTKVRLRLQRQDKKEPSGLIHVVVVLTRARIISRTVEYKILVGGDQRLFHIKVQNFHRPTKRDFIRAVRRAQQWQADGIILDLRFNPGGYVSICRLLASAWLEPDRILFHETKPGVKRRTITVGQHSISGALAGLPTAVLVNGHSASASEILAGTLQDHARATVIGEKTYGKGSVQTQHKLANGGAVMVTIRHWLTPKYRKIHGVGLQPDIKVPWPLKKAIAGMNKPGDPQLQRAIDLLTGKRPAAAKRRSTVKLRPAAAKRPSSKKKRARPKTKRR